EDVLGLINNFGPNDLNGLNFQNSIYVDNTYLNLKNRGTPVQFSLSQNYPNPFNPNTVINYFLPKDAYVKIIVYDILGNNIKELVNQNQQLGSKVINWNAKNNREFLVPAGVYLLTVEVDKVKQTKKMILLK
ncbi:MAG: T9SS type A sorting domain-containing protein, partial [Alphaproteobacteria bacterium]|nr:T9SS type A sorting domain-containing protein [Alphaproteobacteria bacterium]